MSGTRHHLRIVLKHAGFRRLLSTRITSQMADGVFQAGLAGTILFNPDRNTSAMAIAIGFAVLLLPYSLVGPLAGVLIDTWNRRTVLVMANLIRAGLVPLVALMIWFGIDSGAFLPLVLVTIGVQRFFLSGLSAALPHVTDDRHLITANSFAGTTGGLGYAAGISTAMAIRPIVGADDHGYALITTMSIVGYLISAWIASRFSLRALGPDLLNRLQHARLDRAVLAGFRNMVGGARHLMERPSAGYALLAVCAARICYGIALLATLLLFRNYFDSAGFFRAGEIGLGQVMIAAACGNLVAASITPAFSRYFTPRGWLAILLGLLGIADAILIAPYSLMGIIAAGFFTAVAGQGGKFVCETALQHECADNYRGRVFSVFDTLYNTFMVVGLIIAAFTLPTTGKSYPVLTVVCIGYVLLGLVYFAGSKNTGPRIPVTDSKPVQALEAAH